MTLRGPRSYQLSWAEGGLDLIQQVAGSYLRQDWSNNSDFRPYLIITKPSFHKAMNGPFHVGMSHKPLYRFH
jgi:hypothetical protein